MAIAIFQRALQIWRQGDDLVCYFDQRDPTAYNESEG